nr:hypothetical protein [uncultured Nitrososphaera sp.]
MLGFIARLRRFYRIVDFISEVKRLGRTLDNIQMEMAGLMDRYQREPSPALMFEIQRRFEDVEALAATRIEVLEEKMRAVERAHVGDSHEEHVISVLNNTRYGLDRLRQAIAQARDDYSQFSDRLR